MKSVAPVFIGALRHGVDVFFTIAVRDGHGTLFINIVGSALMGVVIGLYVGSHLGEQDTRLFSTTGTFGSFTTFSTFSLGTVTMWERG